MLRVLLKDIAAAAYNLGDQVKLCYKLAYPFLFEIVALTATAAAAIATAAVASAELMFMLDCVHL